MPAAYIDTPRRVVTLRSERLVLLDPAAEKGGPRPEVGTIPMLGLERLVLRENVQISSQALAALLRAGIPCHVVDSHGRHLGGFEPPSARTAAARGRQHQRTAEAEFALAIARPLVVAKLANQRRLLQRLEASRPRGSAPVIDSFTPLLREAQRAANLPALRGLEGAAAAAYFGAWAGFLPPAFPFERRSTRPPHNAVNAVLSFAATLVYGELVSALHLRGLDPGCGLLHVPQDGRWSLALDLMEPFRPALVDSLAMRLFIHRILQPKHFEPKNGGTYLNASGRQVFLQQYERRLRHEFYSEHARHRTTLRQQFTAVVMAYKAALDDPASFAPFRLN